MNNGDPIDNLPKDTNNPLSQQELKIIDTLFQPENKPKFNGLFRELKSMIVIIILYIIFSLPLVDAILKKILPITGTSVYVRILIKSLLFAIIWWLFAQFYLKRNTAK